MHFGLRHDIRVIKSLYWPRMPFDYELRDETRRIFLAGVIQASKPWPFSTVVYSLATTSLFHRTAPQPSRAQRHFSVPHERG